MQRARMLAHLELDSRHDLDSSFFISSREYHESLGILSSSYKMETDSLEEFHQKNKIEFQNLGYGDMHSFVYDKHQYFYFVCIKKVGWEGDIDIDSQCYVKVPYKTIDEIKEEYSFLFEDQKKLDPEWYEFE